MLFSDDVARIVGLSLLYKKFNENMHLKKRQIYLDLRLTYTVFAYHLTVISTERISKTLELTFNLLTSEMPLDRLFLVITKRKNCTLKKSGIGLIEVRRCVHVYRRADSLKLSLVPGTSPLKAKETFIESLTEFALENFTSFYNVIYEDFGIQCHTIIDCYRALYFCKCRQYDKVLDLCEGILHEPDLQSNLKEFAIANVLVLPPLDCFLMVMYNPYLDFRHCCAIYYQRMKIQSSGNSLLNAYTLVRSSFQRL